MSGAGGGPVAALFDAVAADYEATGTAYFDPMGQRLVDLVGLSPGQRVLDVGAGRGAVLRPAAVAVGPRGAVLGLDLSTRMAALTNADLTAAAPGAAAARALAGVVVADAARVPAAGPFDAVLGGMVAQFLPAPGEALRAWWRLAAPGGQLGLSWWAGDDERFAAVDAAVAAHLPGSGPRPARAFSGDVAATEELVRAAGWTAVGTVVEAQHVRFVDAAAWWRWSWSHGQRRRWQAVADLTALRHDVDRELQHLAAPDGSITYRPRAAYTVARHRP